MQKQPMKEARLQPLGPRESAPGRSKLGRALPAPQGWVYLRGGGCAVAPDVAEPWGARARAGAWKLPAGWQRTTLRESHSGPPAHRRRQSRWRKEKATDTREEALSSPQPCGPASALCAALIFSLSSQRTSYASMFIFSTVFSVALVSPLVYIISFLLLTSGLFCSSFSSFFR